MILHFPSLDVLRLALTSGVLPEALRGTPVQFAAGDHQSLWVESAQSMSEKTHKDLRRLGVALPDRCDLPLQSAGHWLQLLPLVRDARPPQIGDKTPVLFELTDARQLAEVAIEMLRLGNDRQSFRWLEKDGVTRALLRVVGPPYYSLLRAIERNGDDGAPIAYREVAPRVWVQIGCAHPLGEHLHPPAGQWLLLRAPRQWTSVPEAKLHDIYEVIEFQLPQPTRLWDIAELPAHINVPVRLTRAGAADAAELWVLGEPGIAQLEDLVRSADNELIARLAFAVGAKNGERVVVVRVRPSKRAPPVLVLDAIACRSYLRIPNLFVPVGHAIHPPLRREAVTRLFAEDKTRVVWLTPGAAGSFTPESVPEDAFRPLSAWVDYVLEHEHEALKTWLSASQFQFESFICKDEAPRKPPREPPTPKAPRKPEANDDAVPAPSNLDAPARKRAKVAAPTEEAAYAEPGELERRLRELEAAFLASPAPLEDAERQAMWRDMARLNGMLRQTADAAVCWGNALWELPTVPPDGPADWLSHEAKQPAASVSITRLLQGGETTQAHIRLAAAHLIWAAALPQPPGETRSHLPGLQQFLEKNETHLGVRVAWLAWHAIYRLSAGDVLTLARARDRLLERLHAHGLTPELDLPGFLRFTGLQASNRFRKVRDQVVRLRIQVQNWAKTGANPVPTTHPYIDLVFAFGLARLGEANEARRLLASAAESLAHADEVHSWLYAAFEFRIHHALNGKLAFERLPDHLIHELHAIEHPAFLEHMPEGTSRQNAKQAQRLIRLKIDRMRENSRILEPLEKIDAFRHWHGRHDDELSRTLADLADLTDRAALGQRLQKVLTGKQKYKGAPKPENRILAAALELAPRLGQSFGEETLERVPGQIAKTKDRAEVANLLEKALLLAAHLDRKEDVQRFVARFLDMLQSPGAVPLERLAPLFAGSFRSLRKFGFREHAALLLERLEAIIVADPIPRSAARHQASNLRARRLALLLHLAAGWFYFGAEVKARALVDEARAALLANDLDTIDQVRTAAAYLAALGQAPMEFALARVMEFFRKVEGIYDVYTTQSHYSLTRYTVVEAMMLALVSDDFTLDHAARQRLDDDEFLIRRRIHRDVRAAMAAGELQ